MDIEAAKSMAKQYKLAIAIAIIRNKPANMSVREFISLLQLKYKNSFMENKQKIERLESELLRTKQELYLLKNKILVDKFNSLVDNPNETINAYLRSQTYTNASMLDENLADDMDHFARLKHQYESHKEFIINLIKLKIIGKKFNIDENTQIILGTLSEFLEQIKFFFFKSNTSTTLPSDRTSTMTSISHEFDSTPINENVFNFSYSCLTHSLQIFVNVFQVEWLYYLRSSLISVLVQFIEDLVKFILEFTDAKTNRMKLECACEMLFCLSTCDYLIDSVLNLIIYGLQNLVKYLCESVSALTMNKESDNEVLQLRNEYLIDNCVDLLDCLDRIVQIRLLQYFSNLSPNTIQNLNKLLDFMFINLTDVYPLLAVKLTKLLQILHK